MRLVRRRGLSGDDLASQIRRRIRDVEVELSRLESERASLKRRLADLAATRPAQKAVKTKKAARRGASGVVCPRCGRDRDFLTDAEGFLAHVLEEQGDDELLTDGKPLFCPACGEVFLYRSGASAQAA